MMQRTLARVLPERALSASSPSRCCVLPKIHLTHSPPMCRFEPTCSVYGCAVLAKHGVNRQLALHARLSAVSVLLCWDPVPEMENHFQR